jgi:glycosyltransferase involved in cell wall biosynthesis
MKILQVSHRVPYPLNEGGTIGIYNYTRGFSEAGHDVTLLALNGKKHRIDLAIASKELEKYCKFFVFDIDTNINPLDAFSNLFSKKSYNVTRFYNRNFERFLSQLLKSKQFDIIQVEGTFVAMYYEVIRQNSMAPIVIRQHNVEYQIWERLAFNESNSLKKWYLNLLAKRLKNFEREFTVKFDALVPVTEDDAVLFKNLGYNKPIFVSPSGIDTHYWQPSTELENPFHIFHLGSLEWAPNREAVMWFINEIWPKILLIDQRFKLFVAGKNMPDSMKGLNINNVFMVGEVKSGSEFISDKAITVVPLLSGSGIRLKILEAMAAAKLVISTTIGAQGIKYTKGNELLIADNLQEFESIFRKISENPHSFDAVKKAGYNLVKTRYANLAVVQELLDFYGKLLHTKST